MRSRYNAVRRVGTLADFIWFCKLFFCRYTMTNLAVITAHYITRRFLCGLTSNLEHPFGHAMEWLFVALVWFAFVVMVFECAGLETSAGHLVGLYSGPVYIEKRKLSMLQDLLGALHGWSGPDSENYDLANVSGLALRVRTTQSSTSSRRGGHRMMFPNIDWHKLNQDEIETINPARRASSIACARQWSSLLDSVHGDNLGHFFHSFEHQPMRRTQQPLLCSLEGNP